MKEDLMILSQTHHYIGRILIKIHLITLQKHFVLPYFHCLRNSYYIVPYGPYAANLNLQMHKFNVCTLISKFNDSVTFDRNYNIVLL